jgi:hypothetical protein
MALVFTALLGIGGFVVQSKSTTAAGRAQQDLEHTRVEHERARELAVVQLARVRSQMVEVYRPVQVMLHQANNCAVYMQYELGFESNEAHGFEFVRPFALWPH